VKVGSSTAIVAILVELNIRAFLSGFGTLFVAKGVMQDTKSQKGIAR